MLTLIAGRRDTSTSWHNTCWRRGARPTTSTPSPCSSTSSWALIGTFKRHSLHLPRLMPPSHAGTCACVTILLLITLHAKPTDYVRGEDDLLRTTPYWYHSWSCSVSPFPCNRHYSVHSFCRVLIEAPTRLPGDAICIVCLCLFVAGDGVYSGCPCVG